MAASELFCSITLRVLHPPVVEIFWSTPLSAPTPSPMQPRDPLRPVLEFALQFPLANEWKPSRQGVHVTGKGLICNVDRKDEEHQGTYLAPTPSVATHTAYVGVLCTSRCLTTAGKVSLTDIREVALLLSRGTVGRRECWSNLAVSPVTCHRLPHT